MFQPNASPTCIASLLPTRWKARFALLMLAALPALCAAREPSVNECVEGSDFIRNAALARDSGVSEDSFLARIHEDIAVIQALPPKLRWFVQDEEDAALLISAATDVFRKPKDANAHQRDFLTACLPKASSKPHFRL